MTEAEKEFLEECSKEEILKSAGCLIKFYQLKAEKKEEDIKIFLRNLTIKTIEIMKIIDRKCKEIEGDKNERSDLYEYLKKKSL